jgi:mRNA interferase RelE/StbE
VYTIPALKDLKTYREMKLRVMKAIAEYAAETMSHANQVKRLAGSSVKRLRVGGFRVLFEETETQIIVTKIAPRGNVYRD